MEQSRGLYALLTRGERDSATVTPSSPPLGTSPSPSLGKEGNKKLLGCISVTSKKLLGLIFVTSKKLLGRTSVYE